MNIEIIIIYDNIKLQGLGPNGISAKVSNAVGRKALNAEGISFSGNKTTVKMKAIPSFSTDDPDKIKNIVGVFSAEIVK